MGQEISHSQYPPDQSLLPGTYRIFNVLVGTAIQVSDHDSTKVVTWEKHEGDSQQANYEQCHISKDIISVQLADRNRVLDLHWGSGHNGNEIHIWNLDGNNMAHRIWGLERLGDESGEGTARTPQDQQMGLGAKEEPTKEELPKVQEQANDRELSQLQDELSRAKQELSELHSLLYQRDETIRQLQQDLKSREEALIRAYKANEESTHLREQHTILESKFSQQQAETASLQAKMDRVEYLMSQMMGKSSGKSSTQT